ncbi:hypothetical protein [Tomitella gaofuii]|uniref:hypothetical protein n=1 Tax=Tomitella gaofuii TaxID=2760083 RepID=UPI0015F90AE4|nr:hypothetical protein [Tomitella gaofuii]
MSTYPLPTAPPAVLATTPTAADVRELLPQFARYGPPRVYAAYYARAVELGIIPDARAVLVEDLIVTAIERGVDVATLIPEVPA